MRAVAKRGLNLSLILLLLLSGCASSTDVNPQQPEIQVEQLPASEFVAQQRGAVSIAYRMTLRNRSAAPVTLRKIEMQTEGRSPYVLRNTPVELNETVAPGKESVVTFEMWAVPREEQTKRSDRVWVRGTATFEGAAGSFRTSFSQSFRQPE